MKFNIGGGIYSQDPESKQWIWKASTPTFKMPKAPHIADKPHHLALKEAIQEEKQEYSQVTRNIAIEIAQYLKTAGNDN